MEPTFEEKQAKWQRNNLAEREANFWGGWSLVSLVWVTILAAIVILIPDIRNRMEANSGITFLYLVVALIYYYAWCKWQIVIKLVPTSLVIRHSSTYVLTGTIASLALTIFWLIKTLKLVGIL